MYGQSSGQTLMVQKYKSVYANLVIPICMDLKHQLNELSVITYNNKMVKTLKLSLDKRLGISMSDDNFLLAAMLDPTIKLRWCNTSEAMKMEEKLQIPKTLMGYLQYMAPSSTD
jgi:acetylglutamate kinase